MTERWHGTPGGYANHKCRCDKCKAAWKAEAAKQKAARLASGLPDGDRRHGTYNGYSNWGCRCADCRSAAAATARNKRRDQYGASKAERKLTTLPDDAVVLVNGAAYQKGQGAWWEASGWDVPYTSERLASFGATIRVLWKGEA